MHMPPPTPPPPLSSSSLQNKNKTSYKLNLDVKKFSNLVEIKAQSEFEFLDVKGWKKTKYTISGTILELI